MSLRTLFLSKLIGLYCILVALSMITRRQPTVETVTTLLQTSSMMSILGVITLAGELAMILAHNIWSGGTLVVVVTLVGWVTLIKGLYFLFLSPEVEAEFFELPLHGCRRKATAPPTRNRTRIWLIASLLHRMSDFTSFRA